MIAVRLASIFETLGVIRVVQLRAVLDGGLNAYILYSTCSDRRISRIQGRRKAGQVIKNRVLQPTSRGYTKTGARAHITPWASCHALEPRSLELWSSRPGQPDGVFW